MSQSFEIPLTGPETNTMTYFSLFENKAVKGDCPLHCSTKIGTVEPKRGQSFQFLRRY